MSRSGWGKLTPIGYGLAVSSLLVGFVLFASTYSEQQKQQAISTQQSGGDSQRAPQQSDTDRAGIPSLAERFISNPEPPKESEKERRDLAAQEATAIWAFWMTAFSLGQLILSGLGLIVIVRTLRQNEESIALASAALVASENAHVAQIRPWLLISATPTGVLSYKPKEIAIKIDIHINNVGSFPAKEITAGAIIYDYSDHDHIMSTKIRFTKNIVPAQNIDKFRKRIAIPSETITIRQEIEHFSTEKNINPAVFVFIRYTFDGSKEFHESGACFKFEIKNQYNEKTIPLTFQCDGFGPNRQTLRSLGMGYAT